MVFLLELRRNGEESKRGKKLVQSQGNGILDQGVFFDENDEGEGEEAVERGVVKGGNDVDLDHILEELDEMEEIGLVLGVGLLVEVDE